jgi:hypothetical protein
MALIVLSDEVHMAALRHARQLGKSELSDRLLNAITNDEDIAHWVTSIWDDVEGAISNAVNYGMEAAREQIDNFSNKLKDLASSLGRKAEEVHDIIKAKLVAYLQRVIDDGLRTVRPVISIGDSELRITSVTVEQRIKLSGSLKASLEELCEFAAEGEISLATEYAMKE